jgi:hypothetical protein
VQPRANNRPLVRSSILSDTGPKLRIGNRQTGPAETRSQGDKRCVVAARVVSPQAAAQLRVNTSGDERAFYRAELRSLNASIGGALAKARDGETRAHLEGARDQIARILDPKFAAPNAAAAP